MHDYKKKTNFYLLYTKQNAFAPELKTGYGSTHKSGANPL